MPGSPVNFYNYIYFTVWDEQLLEFCTTTLSSVMPKDFEAVIKSFSPTTANAANTEEHLPDANIPPALTGDQTIKVFINGDILSFDVPPQIENGRILVPVRAIFESMGADLEYDSNSRTVIAIKGDTEVILTIDDPTPVINGQVVPIDQPGIIVNGRILAPLRFVAEAFGGTVEWDGSRNTAMITQKQTEPASFGVPKETEPPKGMYDRGIQTDNNYTSEYLNLSFTPPNNIKMVPKVDVEPMNRSGVDAMFVAKNLPGVNNTIDNIVFEMIATGTDQYLPLIRLIVVKPKPDLTERQYADWMKNTIKSQEPHLGFIEYTFGEYSETHVAGQSYLLFTVTEQYYTTTYAASYDGPKNKSDRVNLRDIYIRKQDERFVSIEVIYPKTESDMADVIKAFKKLY